MGLINIRSGQLSLCLDVAGVAVIHPLLLAGLIIARPSHWCWRQCCRLGRGATADKQRAKCDRTHMQKSNHPPTSLPNLLRLKRRSDKGARGPAGRMAERVTNPMKFVNTVLGRSRCCGARGRLYPITEPPDRFRRTNSIYPRAAPESSCCARAPSGHAPAAAPPRSVMNLRRWISDPKLRRRHLSGSNEHFDRG